MTTAKQSVADPSAPDHEALLGELAEALRRVGRGDLKVRLPRRAGAAGEVADAFNEVVSLQERQYLDLRRISRIVGRDGRLTERLDEEGLDGSWAEGQRAVNSLIDDLGRPTTEIARVIVAVADGDLSQHMALEIDGRPLRGEFLRIGRTVNTMVDQLSSFADEVTRVAREVGTEGKLGGQADVRGRRRHLEGPHRLGEHHGVEPDRPGAVDLAGGDGGGPGRPVAEDHRVGARARSPSWPTR